jgi:hypothetical protein
LKKDQYNPWPNIKAPPKEKFNHCPCLFALFRDRKITALCREMALAISSDDGALLLSSAAMSAFALGSPSTFITAFRDFMTSFFLEDLCPAPNLVCGYC